jgi:UDP:flavonoid glycosyltransferase YjiC (YdhE family)
MRAAAVVITHGGHGTAMRALSHGAAVVCVTGKAADQHDILPLDQPHVAAFVEEHRVGCALAADAPPDAIREAVAGVLADPVRRGNARRAAQLLGSVDAAGVAAANLAALVPVAAVAGATAGPANAAGTG